MTIIDKENIVPFDCDDTLVIWPKNCRKPGKSKIKLTNGNINYYLKPHKKHIDLLKRYSQRGFTIIVWSGNGFKWAKEVVRALKLQKHVSFVATKPMKYVDDSKADSWMQNIYLKP